MRSLNAQIGQNSRAMYTNMVVKEMHSSGEVLLLGMSCQAGHQNSCKARGEVAYSLSPASIA